MFSNYRSIVHRIVMSKRRQRREQREFDFTKCGQRRIALMFGYLGWDYDGLVEQQQQISSKPDNSTEIVKDEDNMIATSLPMNTIEHHLFAALERTRLIESRLSCEFSRCGRTDKAVSAFRQVISKFSKS
jgi:tRNA pseudouridine38/39 synthase